LVYDDELGDFWHHNVAVDLQVSVPAARTVRIRTFVGDIAVTGVGGGVDVATNDGAIALKDLMGDVRAFALGDIICEFANASTPQGDAFLSVYGGTVHALVSSSERITIPGRVLGPDR
jgi:hypothetical protein